MRWGAVAAVLLALAGTSHAGEPGWPFYGGDAGGQRFSAAAEITPANVANLKPAWRFSTHDLATKGVWINHASFENTPILADGKLYVCSPFNEVSALDPGTGREIWRFDPKVYFGTRYPNELVCRGVAFWRRIETVAGLYARGKASGLCATRLFMATNDRRLIALDAKTGTPCPGFGDRGTVRLIPSSKMIYPTEVQNTSAPVVTHGVVIVGSSIGDNGRVDEPRGTVRAFDAITGKLALDIRSHSARSFRTQCRELDGQRCEHHRRARTSGRRSPSTKRAGLSICRRRVQAPISSVGCARATIAMRIRWSPCEAATGKVVWSFQITHHDVWDYDVPAEPTLGQVTYKGKTAPALIQVTKQGLVFTLDRLTGAPLIPVEERRVPQGGVPGEQLSPTQPFPIAPKQLVPSRIKPDDAYGLTFWDRGVCRDMIAKARAQGMYTPPSTKGTIIYPFTGGGSNWGGMAFDEQHDIAYVNTSSAMHLVTLIPRAQYDAVRAANPNKEVTPQAGAPFGDMREAMLSPLGMPCNPPPWGHAPRHRHA